MYLKKKEIVCERAGIQYTTNYRTESIRGKNYGGSGPWIQM